MPAIKNIGPNITNKLAYLVAPNLKLNVRFLLFHKMTENAKGNVLVPPSCVRGLQKLDRALFAKRVQIPCLTVAEASIGRVLKHLKPFLLKMDNLKPVQALDNDGTNEGKRIVLLSPELSTSFNDFIPHVRESLIACGINENNFGWKEKALTYDNWKYDQVLGAVLPENETLSTGYSRIGHIVHLNLRDHLADYRFLIGEVLLDKLNGVTCVINKTEAIDNTYRNFTMEVIAGSGDTQVKVKENGISYEFDFSHVFWNPRLSSEHERIVEKLPPESVLYDVFAGVGPFAIPAARKRRCEVLANDLNPHSYKWLENNVKLNKVEKRVGSFNMDGRKFIQDVIKQDLVIRWQKYKENAEDVSLTWPECHITMNLPALAVTFLDSFIGLLADYRDMIENQEFVCPIVHCYMFSKEENFQEACIQSVELVLGHRLIRDSVEVFHVRSVAPNKEMIRVTFQLTPSILLGVPQLTNREKPLLEEPIPKKQCVTSE